MVIVENVIFTSFLMGTTIQDGSKRERSNGRRLDWKIGIKNDNKNKSIKRRWVADREITDIKEREYIC